MQPTQHYSLTSPAMFSVLGAQFLSALADNMFIVIALSLVLDAKISGGDAILQAVFVIPFIILAAFVGPFADSNAKGKVMLIGNGIKLLGTSVIIAGYHLGNIYSPIIGYGIAGIGACIYSPAKYGILAQLFDREKLVKANGMMEGSTIVAILAGAVLGGLIMDKVPQQGLYIVAGTYFLATLLNLGIPKLAPTHPEASLHPVMLLGGYAHSVKTLFTNRDARFSLLGTGLFWGASSTLRLMLFAWVPVALYLNEKSAAANLMGATGVGIVIGAGLAAALVKLEHANRALIGGLAIGLLIMLISQVQAPSATENQTALYLAYGINFLTGIAGGFFIVPLNALLQDQGEHTVGAGNAIAVQNFVENIAMLLLVGVYALLKKLYEGVQHPNPYAMIAIWLGGLVLIGMIGLAWSRKQKA